MQGTRAAQKMLRGVVRLIFLIDYGYIGILSHSDYVVVFADERPLHEYATDLNLHRYLI